MQTARAVLNQSTPPQWVVVVDNDADFELRRRLHRELPGVEYIAAGDNPGYGAALALGMRHLESTRMPEWYWLLDDDTPPEPATLARLITVSEGHLDPWVVSNRGGYLRQGRIRAVDFTTADTAVVDYTLVDGSLISGKAVAAVGFPREDLFMMCEDLDYTTRIADAGGTLVCISMNVAAGYLGSGAEWRSYYQARNHLRLALDRRSPVWLFGWVWRIAGLIVFDVRLRRWTRLILRCRGAMDGLRNRMGKTISPT